MNVKKEESKRPVVSANSHGISIAIWNNTNKAGKDYQSISMNGSTKQPDGSYKNRTIFFPSDLENLYEAIGDLIEKAKEQKIQTGFVQK